MRFGEFLRQEGKSVAEAARELNRNHETVRQWAVEGRIPRPDAQRQIFEWSGGVVTPGDWVGTAERPAA